MLLKFILDYQTEKNNKNIKENNTTEKNYNKYYKDVFDYEKMLKNKEFQRNLTMFKNKINEALFSELELNFIKNKNNNYIPKYFTDKIHSIVKIEGDFQICCSGCQNENKIDYFCNNCKVPLHPECFADYHNNKIYNNIFRDIQNINIKV